MIPIIKENPGIFGVLGSPSPLMGVVPQKKTTGTSFILSSWHLAFKIWYISLIVVLSNDRFGVSLYTTLK